MPPGPAQKFHDLAQAAVAEFLEGDRVVNCDVCAIDAANRSGLGVTSERAHELLAQILKAGYNPNKAADGVAVVMRDSDLPATLEFNRALVSSASGFLAPVTDSRGEVLHQYQYTLLGRNQWWGVRPQWFA